MSEFGFTSCPICKLVAKIGHWDHLNWLIVDCQRCGKYKITMRAATAIEAISKDVPHAWVKLSYWVRKSQQFDKQPEILTQGFRELVKEIILPNPNEQSNILLSHIGQNISTPSMPYSILISTLHALLGAPSWRDIKFVIDHLEKKQHIRSKIDRFQRDSDTVEFRFTYEGWEMFNDTAKRSSSADAIQYKVKAIVFTDIAGFTEMAAKNEQVAYELLHAQRELLQPIVNRLHGKWINEMGDGLLLTFDSSIEAVRCCLEIQDVASALPSLKLRIGINVGDVIITRDNVYGDNVNIASRIENLSPVGGIAISRKVQEDISSSPEFNITSLGIHDLKGKEQPVEIFTVVTLNG